MAAKKKSNKSATAKKPAAKKAAGRKPDAKILPVVKKKMGRPATYRYFTATVKFRYLAEVDVGVRALQKELAARLAVYDGLKVTVSEVSK